MLPEMPSMIFLPFMKEENLTAGSLAFFFIQAAHRRKATGLPVVVAASVVVVVVDFIIQKILCGNNSGAW